MEFLIFLNNQILLCEVARYVARVAACWPITYCLKRKNEKLVLTKVGNNFFFVKVCLTSILQKPLDQIKAAPLLRFCGSAELAEVSLKQNGGGTQHPPPI